MIKTVELRKVIKASLKSIHSRVHFKHAPDKATYPYLVYDLPNSTDDGLMERFVLEVDGWDRILPGQDTTTLETLMDSADKELHRKVIVVNGELALIFYRENRLSPTDDDSRIRRRKYVYQIRTYGE
jgi:hypothetical protein